MRQVDKAEDMPFLSPPIRAPLPEKLPVASKDGKFVTGIDGKISTSLPLPPTIWDRFKISGYYGSLPPQRSQSVAVSDDAPLWACGKGEACYGSRPPTRSQSLTAAGHCRRATWHSLPSDE